MRSGKAGDSVRDVWFFQSAHLFLREVQRQRSNRVVQVVRLGGTDNGRGDGRVLCHPGEGDLRAWNAAHRSRFMDAIAGGSVTSTAAR